MKKVLISSTSRRAHSNSEALAHEFEQGAKESGHDVTFVSMRGKDIRFCQGCLACQKVGHCVIRDDANAITEQMLTADVIVFATPIYYYEMSGQLKKLLDRANSLFPKDNAFRDIYFLSSAAEPEDDADRRALTGLDGWIACYEKCHLADKVLAYGVTDPGEISGHPALKEAHDMGRNV